MSIPTLKNGEIHFNSEKSTSHFSEITLDVIEQKEWSLNYRGGGILAELLPLQTFDLKRDIKNFLISNLIKINY